MQERSAGLVLKRGDEYLVLHYDAGHWDFPKGKIEKDETPEDAAMRELEEETGIAKASIVPGFAEKIEYFFRRKGGTVHKEVVFFVATTDEKNVTVSEEHQGYAWLPFDDAVRKVTFENAKGVLEKAHAFLSHVKE